MKLMAHNMQEKERRLEAILALIAADRIGTQQGLAARLEGMGFAVTQSSVSRDLEELGIVKRHGRYTPPDPATRRELLGLDVAGEVLVVAKCLPAMASPVAAAIDQAALDGVVGTLAGDDTVFIAVRGGQFQGPVIRAIWKLFGKREERK